jgi:hypothetical protein
MTFLINLVTYSDFEEEVSVRKFLKMFYARSAEEPENLRLYIFQVSFWMMVPMLFLVNAANR